MQNKLLLLIESPALEKAVEDWLATKADFYSADINKPLPQLLSHFHGSSEIEVVKHFKRVASFVDKHLSETTDGVIFPKVVVITDLLLSLIHI